MVLTIFQGMVLFACYLLFAGQLSWSELGIALPSAALAAAFLVVLRHSATHHLSLRTSFWPRLVMKSLFSVPPDTMRVGRVLLKILLHGSGTEQDRFQHQPFVPGGNDPADAGRRALVTLGISLAPNGYVLDISANELLVHRLQPASPKSNREWPV